MGEVKCLNCYRANKDILGYLQSMLKSQKILIALIDSDGKLYIKVSEDISYLELVSISEVLKKVKSE